MITIILIAGALLVSLGATVPLQGFPDQDFKLPAEDNPNNDLMVVKENSFSLVNSLLYRLDVVSCEDVAPMPEAGYSIAYLAWPYFSYWSGTHKCFAQKREARSYRNNMIHLSNYMNGQYRPCTLQYFHIKCTGAVQVYLQLFKINLKERHKVGDKMICLDYIKIFQPSKNYSCELCGTETNVNCSHILNGNPLLKQHAELIITYRTGPHTNNGYNFSMNMNCLNPVEQNMEGCLETSRSFSWEHYKQQSHKENLIELAAVMNYVPRDAVKLLFDFYNAYEDKTLTANSMESYKDILALAIIAEKSCDASIKSVGREIQKLFPESVRVGKVESDFYEETDSYIDSVPNDFVY